MVQNGNFSEFRPDSREIDQIWIKKPEENKHEGVMMLALDVPGCSVLMFPENSHHSEIGVNSS